MEEAIKNIVEFAQREKTSPNKALSQYFEQVNEITTAHKDSCEVISLENNIGTFCPICGKVYPF